MFCVCNSAGETPSWSRFGAYDSKSQFRNIKCGDATCVCASASQSLFGLCPIEFLLIWAKCFVGVISCVGGNCFLIIGMTFLRGWGFMRPSSTFYYASALNVLQFSVVAFQVLVDPIWLRAMPIRSRYEGRAVSR